MYYNLTITQNYFICKKCGQKVSMTVIGTKNRNHCPFCLWSLHVDKEIPGDRYDTCQGMMEPVGLTFKDEGIDKYGKKRQGEIMLVHQCQKCGKENKNRIAGDDDAKAILALCEKKDEEEVKRQLFGKNGLSA